MNKTNLISFDSFFLSVDDGIHRGRIMSGRFRIFVGVVRFIVFLGPSAFFSSLFYYEWHHVSIFNERKSRRERRREDVFRRLRAKISRSRQRANDESLQTDETIPRTNRTRTDRERERNNKCVPCANRRLKSTSHRWVYLRRKSKPSFQTSRRRIQIRFRRRKEDEFSSSPLFLK